MSELTFLRDDDQRSEPNSFEVAIPLGTSPVIQAKHVRDPTQPIPAFDDDSWPLGALGRVEGTRAVNIHWRKGAVPLAHGFPELFREPARLAAYLLINEGTHSSIVDRRWTPAVKWLAPSTLNQVIRAWAAFATWLEADGIIAIADVDSGTLEAYQRYVQALDVTPTRKVGLLHALWRLHGCALQMPVDSRLIRPPWSESGAGFADNRIGENLTAIISPNTMDATIVWALRFIREFAPDILAARALTDSWVAQIPTESRMVGTGPDGRHTRGKSPVRARVRSFLEKYLPEQNWRVPGTDVSSKELTIAGFYLAARYGLPDVVGEVLREEFRGQFTITRAVKTEVGAPIYGRVDGRPWTDHIDFYDVAMRRANDGLPALLMHLRTACLIAASYFTGMRPGEVLTLRPGCVAELPADPDHPEGINGFLIAGILRKHIRTSDGRVDLDGKVKDWGTIRVGAEALLLAERISPGRKYLFGTGTSAMKTTLANKAIAGFTDYVNALVKRMEFSSGHLIQPDTDGLLNITRFRRSIAHHIENQPESEFVLANQFKHLEPSLSRNGYAATASVGERRQMDRDAAQQRMQTLMAVEELLTQGGGVSGPAARRLISAAEAAAPFQATYLSESEVRRIVADPALQVFDNPGQYSLCVYKESTARCSSTDAPDRGSCDKACANHARTDAQIDKVRREEQQHRIEAESPLAPKPVRIRLLNRAEIERELIERHERERRFQPGGGPQGDGRKSS